MSNSYSTNPIVLDTFTSEINLKTELGQNDPRNFRVEFIL